MENFTRQLFDILISPPGNLVYHLILVFAVAVSLQSALAQRRQAPVVARRALLGLGMVLAAQLVMFAGSGLAWQQIAQPQLLLPPLDRAMTAFGLLWVTWLWCFPRPARLADAVAALASLAILILALFTVNAWVGQAPAAAFNGSIYNLVWSVLSPGIAALGMLVLLLARPASWETGIAMLGLLVAGFVAHLLLPTPAENFAGAVRLAQLCAYPLLPVAASRLGGYETAQKAAAAPAARVEELNHRARQAWMRLLVEQNPDQAPLGLARSMAHSMRADMCLLLAAPGPDQIWIARGGYDLVGDQPLPLVRLDGAAIPTVSAALQRGKSVNLLESPAPLKDQVSFGRALGLNDCGSLLAVPLICKGAVWGALVLLSPYAARSWSETDQKALESDAEDLALILQQPNLPSPQTAETEQINNDLAKSVEQIAALKMENQRLSGELTAVRSRPALETSAATPGQVEALLALQKESQELIAGLQSENEELHTLLAARPLHTERSAEMTQLQEDLRITLEEIAHQRNALAEADIKISQLQQRSPAVSLPASEGELMASAAQELRQSMAAVSGYCNLMLVETGGSLTPLQQTFLERLKISIEEMQTVLDNLLFLAGRGNTASTTRQAVDMNDLVDQAVAKTAGMLRRKSLTLRVDLPEQPQRIRVHPLAVRQTLVNLFRNAVLTSPEGSTITLRAAVEENGPARILALRLIDSGGGIPAEKPVGASPLITGNQIKETGLADNLGMAVTQLLVQDQNGELQVESDPGKSMTYTVRIPAGEDHATGLAGLR